MSIVQAAQATRAGVGYSEKPAGRDAGAEAAAAAMAQAGLDSCDLVLAFATGKQDPAAVRDGVRSIVGERAHIVGGATVGVITGNRLGFEGHQVGVAVLRAPRVSTEILLERSIADREYEAGEALGRRIRSRFGPSGPDALLLLYDIVKTSMGSSLNLATPLLAGMTAALGEWPATVGGGLMGNLQFSSSFQFVGDEITSRGLIGLALQGDLRMDALTIHGCRPSGRYYTITKADGCVVLELDGQPAAEVVARMLGPDRSSWEDYPLFVTLGINNGDPFGPYREDDYAVRLCSAVDRERGGLAFFGDDLQPGRQVQLMRRSIDLGYMADRVSELLGRLDGRRPVLALYIDCAGRCSAMSGSDGEEATEIQRALGGEVPLLGWYVGGEIARAGDVMQSHNWTGVLSILSEPSSS
jgi:hypothetical protein